MNSVDTFLQQWPPYHHAYVITSASLKTEDVVQHLPDEDMAYIYQKEFDVLKIDDARKIKDLQHEKTEGAAVFVIKCGSINSQAQNALLKVLEEPTPNTYFFIIYPNVKQLLPTLQSRLEIISVASEVDYDGELDVSVFISGSLSERFALIKKYTDVKAKDEKLSKQQVSHFLNKLEVHYQDNERNEDRRRILSTLNDARRYLLSNGSSIKMILDLVAVNIG